jgi:hypothetical protein
MVKLYLHSHTLPHGMVFNELSPGITSLSPFLERILLINCTLAFYVGWGKD